MNSETLEVRLRGKKIGELTRTKNGARFTFSEEVASTHPFSPLLSTALCVQERPPRCSWSVLIGVKLKEASCGCIRKTARRLSA